MTTHRTTIAQGGRVVIPVALRNALGVRVGDSVIMEFADGELRVRSLNVAIREAQEMVARHLPKGVSLADELIRERREEARREEQE